MATYQRNIVSLKEDLRNTPEKNVAIRREITQAIARNEQSIKDARAAKPHLENPSSKLKKAVSAAPRLTLESEDMQVERGFLTREQAESRIAKIHAIYHPDATETPIPDVEFAGQTWVHRLPEKGKPGVEFVTDKKGMRFTTYPDASGEVKAFFGVGKDGSSTSGQTRSTVVRGSPPPWPTP